MSKGYKIIALLVILAVAIVLNVAHRKKRIVLSTWGSIATILGLILAVAIFIIPSSESPQKPEKPIPAPEPTPIPSDKKSYEDKRLSEFKTLINRDITTYPNKSNVAFVIASAKNKSGFSAENTLYNLLRSEKIQIIINLFKEEQFKSTGFFKEIYDGNTEILKRADALSKIDYIVLGKINYSFRKGAVDSDLVSCDINFSYKIINKKAEIVRSDNISVIGPGFSEDAALERGLEILAEKYSDRILKSVL